MLGEMILLATSFWQQCYNILATISWNHKKISQPQETEYIISMMHKTRNKNWKSSHAYPEWYFQILSTPDVHARVIGADLVEIVAVDGKQSTSHCRRSVSKKTANHVNTSHTFLYDRSAKFECILTKLHLLFLSVLQSKYLCSVSTSIWIYSSLLYSVQFYYFLSYLLCVCCS